MAALRELFAEYFVKFKTKELEDGAEKTEEADGKLKDLDDTAKKVSRGIAAFGGAIAAVFATGAVRDMVTSTINATNELARWGQRLNTNVGEIAAWSRIAEPFGANIDDVTDSLKELQLKAQDAISGGTSQAEMFQRIGIGLDDLRPVVNDVNGLMDLFVGRLNDVNDAGLRNFTVDELMSDAGTRMLPVFMQGAERLRELRGEMMEGAGATIALAERMGAWNTTSARVNSSLENLKATVVLSILPALERTADMLVPVINAFQDMVEDSRLLEASMATLTAVMIGVGIATAPIWGPMALTIAGVAAAILVVIAIVDDLWVTLEGGDSITRRFIDGMLGVGKTKQMIENLAQAWRDLKGAMSEVGRFIASTPALNFITAGLFEGSLSGSERGQAARNREQMGSLTTVEGANLTLGSALGTSYRSRRDRNRTESVRAEDVQEQQELGQYFPDFFQQPEDTSSMSIPSGGGVVNQSSTTNVTVNGGGDPRQAAEEVRRVVREENERQLRQTRANLVPGAS